MCSIFLNFPGGSRAREIDPTGLNDTKTWNIGRSPHADIRFTCMETSRHHALLRTDDCQWELMDLNSPNGTRINGAKIKPRQWIVLQESDHLEFGTYKAKIVVSFIKDDTLNGSEESEPVTAFNDAKTDTPIEGDISYASAIVRIIERAPTDRLVLAVVAFLAGLAIFLLLGAGF